MRRLWPLHYPLTLLMRICLPLVRFSENSTPGRQQEYQGELGVGGVVQYTAHICNAQHSDQDRTGVR